MKERETNKFFTIIGNFQILLTLSLIESNGLKSPEIRISILWIWSNYKSFLQINFHGHYGNFNSASRLVSSVKGLSYFQRFILINDAWTVEIAVEQRMEFLVEANELVAIIRIR